MHGNFAVHCASPRLKIPFSPEADGMQGAPERGFGSRYSEQGGKDLIGVDPPAGVNATEQG